MATLFLLAGCTHHTHQMKTSMSEEDLVPYLKDGTATVEGQTFLKTRGGSVIYGAGVEVGLMPSNPYSNEIVQNFGRKTTMDPRFLRYCRFTQADGQGNFRFVKVPRGTYYLFSKITWEIPNSFMPEGGYIVKNFVLTEGEHNRIMLTR